MLELPRKVPSTGSVFVVYRPADTGSPNQRLLGWEDSDAGKHGIGLMPDPDGRLHAILRNDGRSGDLVDAHASRQFRARLRHLGLARHDIAPQRGGGRVAKRDRGRIVGPGVAALRLGGPGSGAARATAAISPSFAFTTGNWMKTSAAPSRPNCAPRGSTPLIRNALRAIP